MLENFVKFATTSLENLRCQMAALKEYTLFADHQQDRFENTRSEEVNSLERVTK